MSDDTEFRLWVGKKTADLEQELAQTMEMGTFLRENQTEFVSYELADVLEDMIRRKGVSKAETARQAQMSDIYLFQILSGRRRPSRDRLICICIGLGCSLEETRDLLRKCRYADLYVRDRRDAMIMFGLQKGQSLGALNDALYAADEDTLV